MAKYITRQPLYFEIAKKRIGGAEKALDGMEWK
jgi:hypothetical protein